MISVSVIDESNDEHGDPERIEVVLSFCDSTHQNLTGVKVFILIFLGHIYTENMISLGLPYTEI